MAIPRRVAVAFLLFGAGAASSSQPQPQQSGLPGQAGVRRCAERQMEASHFSGVVSLAYRNRPAWTLTSGRMAGPESSPIAADTRFNLGSASKMFTAIAVAQLLDSGKVHLDDAVGRYVDGLDPDASRVTVRQLLTHTSGLRDFFRPEMTAPATRRK